MFGHRISRFGSAIVKQLARGILSASESMLSKRLLYTRFDEVFSKSHFDFALPIRVLQRLVVSLLNIFFFFSLFFLLGLI